VEAAATSERVAFLRAWKRDVRAVGSILPSSAGISRKMAALLGAERLTNVAEMGAGTGPVTRALLDAMPAEGRLWSFEIDPVLAAGLRERFDDPRLTVVAESASEAPRIAREARLDGFDGIVSAIPYTLLPRQTALDLLDAHRRALLPGAPLVLIQYRPEYIVPFLRRLFGGFERHFYLWNVPPGFLFRVRRPR
jgi:phosphatidylethanolamine/phosphatidyl-N-methylethanolamine N-methyltransferase